MTSTEPGVPAGVFTVIDVLLKLATVAAESPKATVGPAPTSEKFVPVIVTDVPPAESPDAGLTSVMVGDGASIVGMVNSTVDPTFDPTLLVAVTLK